MRAQWACGTVRWGGRRGEARTGWGRAGTSVWHQSVHHVPVWSGGPGVGIPMGVRGWQRDGLCQGPWALGRRRRGSWWGWKLAGLASVRARGAWGGGGVCLSPDEERNGQAAGQADVERLVVGADEALPDEHNGHQLHARKVCVCLCAGGKLVCSIPYVTLRCFSRARTRTYARSTRRRRAGAGS